MHFPWIAGSYACGTVAKLGIIAPHPSPSGDGLMAKYFYPNSFGNRKTDKGIKKEYFGNWKMEQGIIQKYYNDNMVQTIPKSLQVYPLHFD